MGPFRDVFWNLIRVAPDRRDTAAVERGLVRCRELFAMANAALADSPYLSGERFAMGDIPLGCLVYGWYAIPVERPDLPHLRAWYERLGERPAYRKAVMQPLT